MMYAGIRTASRDVVMVTNVIMTVLGGGLACLYVPIVCSTGYTKELAISNFDMLRGTLLKPADVVWGKFRAALLLCAVVSVGCAFVNAPAHLQLVGERHGAYILFLTYGSLFTTLMQGAAVGLLSSFYAKRAGTAILMSFSILFMLNFGFFFLGMVVFDPIYGLHEEDLIVRLLMTGSPIVWYFVSLSEATNTGDLPWAYDWLVNTMVVAVFCLATQVWIIRRFDARIEKHAKG
jgi:hypothetical protein